MIYRWLSTTGEEILVLPVGEAVEYNMGNSSTALVPCLILLSEPRPMDVGCVVKFALANLKPFVSLDTEGKVSS